MPPSGRPALLREEQLSPHEVTANITAITTAKLRQESGAAHTHLRLLPQPQQRRVRRNPTRKFRSHTADPRMPSEPVLDWGPQEEGCAVLTLAGTSKAWPMLGGRQLCDCGEVTCPSI